MPVVVTGADLLVGRALVPLLRERGSEVRATVRGTDAVEPLRALGAKVAVDAESDAETLRAVLDEAHTVCHLSGSLFLSTGETYEEAIVESTRSVVGMAKKAKVKRFLFVSYPGASSASANDFLQANGFAEEAVAESGLEHGIVRCTHIYGPGSPWLEVMAELSRRRPPVVFGDGSQRMAPVFGADVARALAAADDRAVPVTGAYGLQGPDVLTADEWTDLLAGRSRQKRYVGPDEAGSADLVGWSSWGTVWEVLAADSLADAPDAVEEFRLKRTSLADGLAAAGFDRR